MQLRRYGRPERAALPRRAWRAHPTGFSVRDAKGVGDGRVSGETRRATDGLPQDYIAVARNAMEVRLVDLSLTGARIEHWGLLNPGVSCELRLPAPFGHLVVSAQVVWCTVLRAERRAGGDRHLRARSGLRFATLTTHQQAVLAGTLGQLTRTDPPPLDSQSGSA